MAGRMPWGVEASLDFFENWPIFIIFTTDFDNEDRTAAAHRFSSVIREVLNRREIIFTI
jgi:hypothetical protein